MTCIPDIFALFQIEGEAQNFDVELPEKEFEWTYWFYSESDDGDHRAVYKVALEPEKSVDVECDTDVDDACDVLGRVFLTQDQNNVLLLVNAKTGQIISE